MSSDTNEAVVRRFYEEVFNRGRVDLLEERVEGAEAHALGVRHTYRDFRVTIDRQIARGGGS